MNDLTNANQEGRTPAVKKLLHKIMKNLSKPSFAEWQKSRDSQTIYNALENHRAKMRSLIYQEFTAVTTELLQLLRQQASYTQLLQNHHEIAIGAFIDLLNYACPKTPYAKFLMASHLLFDDNLKEIDGPIGSLPPFQWFSKAFIQFFQDADAYCFKLLLSFDHTEKGPNTSYYLTESPTARRYTGDGDQLRRSIL